VKSDEESWVAAKRYRIVYRPVPESPEQLLRRTADPDQATISFHEVLSRLKREQAHGEVLLQRINGEACTLLREQLQAS
jgi:hypothetical protein